MYGQPDSTYNEYAAHQHSNFSLGHGDMSSQLANGCSNYGNFYEDNGYSGQHDMHDMHDRYSGLPTCTSSTTFSTYNNDDTSSKVSQDRSYIMDYSTTNSSGPTGVNQNYNFPYWSTEGNETNCSTHHSWGMGWSSSVPTTTTTASMASKMLNADQKSVQSVATLMSNQQQTSVAETETATSAAGHQNKIADDFYCLPIFSPPPSNVYSDSVLEWNARSIVLNANCC